MKTKKATKDPHSASIESNGIVKKKNKKKDKSLAQKLSVNSEVTEAVEAASGAAASPVSSKNKKLKKKTKNKENNLRKPALSAANGISSNTKELQMKNGDVNSHKPVDNTVNADTHTSTVPSLSGSSAKNKKEEKTNAVNSQASAGSTGVVKKNNKGAKRRKAKRERELSRAPESNEEKEQRTIFVGNVSTKTTRKRLTRFFSKYGKVETVRLRCAAVPTPGTTKRQAVITNTFHEKRTSLSAYVRFTETAMVEAALKANGAELDKKHLQVDRSQGTTDRNVNLAVFVGNLAFEAEEEALRTHFTSCGEIASVRIIRDKKMASGKGFGYVNFESEDAVEMALQKDGQVFMHRQLRVQRCTKQGKKKGSKPTFKTQGKKGLSFMKTKPTSAKSQKKQNSFSGKKMIETKKFKKMKAKAKFTKEDRKKKAIAHKLAGKKPKMVTA